MAGLILALAVDGCMVAWLLCFVISWLGMVEGPRYDVTP